MSSERPNDVLEGVTLQAIVEELYAAYGWEELGKAVNVRCFTHEPSVASSLKFLRKHLWARVKVEDLYVKHKVGHWCQRNRGI
jgi:uncharacterized protein (DUF2132 family)